MNNRVLITGGAGYIGSHVAKLFLEQGYQVVVFDNFSRGYHEAIDVLAPLGDIQVVEGDLTDMAALHRAFVLGPFEAVIHLAAPCSVDESMKMPKQYFDDNVSGTVCVLEAMKDHQVKNIIFSSTCAVYGDAQYLPLDEQHPLNPDCVYGEVKLMAEKAIQWYSQIYNFNYIIFRFFNACGAASDGLVGDSKKPSLLLMPNVVRGALGIEDFSLTFAPVATEDGSPIRDYIDVEDLAKAAKHAVEYLQAGKPSEIFNIGNGVGYSVKQIVAAVEAQLGLTIARKQGQPRVGEIPAIYAKNDKMKNVFGYQPEKELTASISSMVNWFKKRPNGYNY